MDNFPQRNIYIRCISVVPPVSGEGHIQNSRAEVPKPIVYRTLPVALPLCCQMIKRPLVLVDKFHLANKKQSDIVVLILFYMKVIAAFAVRKLYEHKRMQGIRTTGVM